MGATNCPETPRQRMIGMMYLVLTAMLALNVSKDILDAFAVVDETMTISNQNAEKTVEANYDKINRQVAILGAEKVGDAATKADALKNTTADLLNYIEQTRIELLRFADESELTKEEKPKTAKEIEKKDQSSNATNFFINQGRATELKKRIDAYRNEILDLVKPEQREQIAKYVGLETNDDYRNNDNDSETWEKHNFEGTILIASVTLLNKLVGEVKNAESTILTNILGSISEDDYKFDKIDGRTIPKSEIVFQGDKYYADVIVAAYDSKQTLEVFYKTGVDSLPINQETSAEKILSENGVAKLELSAGIGDHKFAGFIKVKKPDGTDGHYHFNNKFSVIQPTATIAADKMNVLYAGIENPLSVSASVPRDKLSLSVPGCTVTKTATGWNVTVPTNLVSKREVTATATANLDGKSQTMSSHVFRLKTVPDPYPVIGANIRQGRRTKQELLANPAIFARMGDDFVYDLKWQVLSYSVVFVVKGIEENPIVVQGSAFSDALRNKINSSPTGTSIYFTGIRVRSAAGERTLQEISVRLR